MAVFYNSVGTGDYFYQPVINLSKIPLSWSHTASGSQIAVIVGVSFFVHASEITGAFAIERTATYGSKTMTSLGIVEHDDGHAWTEIFGLLNAPSGKQTVDVLITKGLSLVGRIAKGSSVAYTGVSGFGTVTSNFGTGSSMTISGTAPSASVVVTAFGTQDAGIAAYNKNQRYYNSAHSMALSLGDADGTGSAISFSASRGAGGDWGSMAVVLTAADVVASGTPVYAEPEFAAIGRRYPRSPGFVRRTVFNAQPEK